MVIRIARHVLSLPTVLVLFVGITACDAGPPEEAPARDASGAEASLPPGPATYVELLGRDTTAMDRFERTADRIEGTFVDRNPVTRVIRYTGELGPDGFVEHLSGEVRTPETNPEGDEPWTFDVRMEGDSARIVSVTEPGDTSRTTVAVEPGVILSPPRIPMPASVVELAASRLVESGADSIGTGFLQPPSGRIFPSAVYRASGDTIAVVAFGQSLLVRLSEGGRLLAIDGTRTTTNIRVEPATDALDVLALADTFAARDARGEGIGTPSPTVTVSETVAGANIEIEYSRPAMRGREIWGGLVPWSTVWRTGANAATVLTTDRDLVLAGNVELPRGSYTLWSTYTPEQGTLIINSQTGQWGTQYDEERDFVRVPMESEPTDAPVERFTISVEPVEGGGVLALTWDGRRYEVAFAVE